MSRGSGRELLVSQCRERPPIFAEEALHAADGDEVAQVLDALRATCVSPEKRHDAGDRETPCGPTPASEQHSVQQLHAALAAVDESEAAIEDLALSGRPVMETREAAVELQVDGRSRHLLVEALQLR